MVTVALENTENIPVVVVTQVASITKELTHSSTIPVVSVRKVSELTDYTKTENTVNLSTWIDYGLCCLNNLEKMP